MTHETILKNHGIVETPWCSKKPEKNIVILDKIKAVGVEWIPFFPGPNLRKTGKGECTFVNQSTAHRSAFGFILWSKPLYPWSEYGWYQWPAGWCPKLCSQDWWTNVRPGSRFCLFDKKKRKWYKFCRELRDKKIRTTFHQNFYVCWEIWRNKYVFIDERRRRFDLNI